MNFTSLIFSLQESFCFYVSGRMGNTKQALHLIVNELRDVTQAIDFCKEHGDEELWEDLIDYSLDKPCKCICMCMCVCICVCVLHVFVFACVD